MKLMSDNTFQWLMVKVSNQTCNNLTNNNSTDNIRVEKNCTSLLAICEGCNETTSQCKAINPNYITPCYGMKACLEIGYTYLNGRDDLWIMLITDPKDCN
jgi:hypothetical protein